MNLRKAWIVVGLAGLPAVLALCLASAQTGPEPFNTPPADASPAKASPAPTPARHSPARGDSVSAGPTVVTSPGGASPAGTAANTSGSGEVVIRSVRPTAVVRPSRSPNANADAPPDTVRFASLNDVVLAVVRDMPRGGQYTVTHQAFVALDQAIKADPEGHLLLRPELAHPVFCSGATYLVLLKVIDRLNREGRLPLSPEMSSALLVRSEPDGTGIWGRWNANGPGTARLFHETQLGENFTSFDDAQPGDFLKIWWNDNIGAKERGHSVVYLGTSVSDTGVEMVNFWSANMPDGFGRRSVPRSQMHRVLFSRLENPEALNRILEIPVRDNYLAEMLKRGSTEQEMFRMVGVNPGRNPTNYPKPGQTQPNSSAAAPRNDSTASDDEAARTVPPDQPGTPGAAAHSPARRAAATPKPSPSPSPSPSPRGFLQRVFNR